jgi:hypothetical protein
MIRHRTKNHSSSVLHSELFVILIKARSVDRDGADRRVETPLLKTAENRTVNVDVAREAARHIRPHAGFQSLVALRNERQPLPLQSKCQTQVR